MRTVDDRRTQHASIDSELEHFAMGSPSDGLTVATTSTSPEVILTPAMLAEFGAEAMPEDWFVEGWKEGGTAHLKSGALLLDGVRAGYAPLFGSNRSLEFVATFSRRPHQHVGFGTNFKDVPWVSFSTKFGHSVYARSNFFIPEDSRLSPSLLGSPHRYRINWNVIDLEFWVDGRRAVHQLVPIVGYMRPLASNGSLGGEPLSVEWMRMSPYQPSGAFTSRVHDAGQAVRWDGCEWDGDQPALTDISFEIRAGDGPQPDGGWSTWTAAGHEPRPTGRFAQYRAHLATGNSAETPVVRAVTLRYSGLEAGGGGGGGDNASSSSSSGPS